MGTATEERPGQGQSAEEGGESGLIDRFFRAIAPPPEWTEAYARR